MVCMYMEKSDWSHGNTIRTIPIVSEILDNNMSG